MASSTGVPSMLMDKLSVSSSVLEQADRLTRQADTKTAAAILLNNRLIYMSPLFKPCHASLKDGPHFLYKAYQMQLPASGGFPLP